MALGCFHSSIATSAKEGRQITETRSVILHLCLQKHERNAYKEEMVTISLEDKPADEHQKLIKRSPSSNTFFKESTAPQTESFSSRCCQCNII